MIICPHCRTNIPTQAIVCPNCTRDISYGGRTPEDFGLVDMLMFLMFAGVIIKACELMGFRL